MSISPSFGDPRLIPELASEVRTLVDLLRLRAAGESERRAYLYLFDDGTSEESLTYAELDQQARAIGAWLQKRIEPGERVLLLYPPGLQYIAAFFGCLYAGAVAVPAYPPRNNRNLLRLQSLVGDARATLSLTTGNILSRIASKLSEHSYLETLTWLASDQIPRGIEDEWIEPAVGDESLALLQYTSGSTSAPKGVMVSHRNLLHNEQLIQRVFQQTDQSIIVGWLPLYHDMGLIGNIIQPLFVAAPSILMSPVAFLQKPLRWLEAISRYGATTSGGPNFAYELCVRKISEEERAGLDLSSWRVAFNGSEPIRHETLERFAATFEPCGFRREAFHPCYGLAEATLIVSGHLAPRPLITKTVEASALELHRVVESLADVEARSVVGCGSTLAEQRVIIVNPETHKPCAPDEIGEVWVAGPSVAQGYWDNSEETERTFRAYLAESGEGPFLRTGDLGFVQDAELFITGRLKDLIIIRGRNHYPQDIELTAEKSHPALRPGCGAAFSVMINGEEQLVVVQELELRHRADTEEVFIAIREAVAEQHELQSHAVVLIKPGALPKTSSGKIQRNECRARFQADTLAALAQWSESAKPLREAAESVLPAPVHETEEIERWLMSQFASQLGLSVELIDATRPLAHYALDSLAAIELMHRIQSGLGVVLPMTSFLQDLSIRQLAAQAETELRKGAPDWLKIEADASPEVREHALSYGQQAMWFLYRLSPDSPAYNIAVPLRIRSHVDAATLKRALQQLVDRHSTLRTTFSAPHGEPLASIHEHSEVYFQQVDASDWSEMFFNEKLVEEAHRPFDLENGPLLRLMLYRRSVREHVLMLAVHHIAADFWSLTVLMNELATVYQAIKDGRTATLARLRLQYTDYARWQQKMLKEARGDQLFAYWEKHLAGELPVLNLMGDWPRPPVQTFRGAAHLFEVDAELTASLKELGHSCGATLYMTLLAVFQVLLHRHTGQEDILVGTPTAGRTHSDLTDVVGYFVNPVVMRGDLSGRPTFHQFLSRTRRTVLDAFEHQEYPFPLLVKRLQPKRDSSRSPLFQAMFILQKAHVLDEAGVSALSLGQDGVRVNLGALELESVSLKERVAQFDLTLLVAEEAGGLSACFEYNTDLFDHCTIERMSAHLTTLLKAIVSEPEHLVADLPLLPAEEQHRLLVEWNATQREYGDQAGAACLHHLFERQSEMSHVKVAVECDRERLTYGELNARANRLAQRLRNMGVGPESLVCILMERSVEMVVAILGVLKAGGAYVPLDPAYPQERLTLMLEDTQAEVLVTQPSLVQLLPQSKAHIVFVAEEMQATEENYAANSQSDVVADNLAYIIYTSGSTGRPKGVAITHRSAVTLMHWAKELFAPEDYAAVLASTSVCFDLSIFELFVPLSWGGKVVIAENALALHTLPGAQEVTLVNTVPSAMSEMVKRGGLPASVRTVNLAGEALKNALVQEVYSQSKVQRVFNLYGPSEDTTYSTFTLTAKESNSEPTIGRPVSNTQAYLLDARLWPVPIGVAGELYLGGGGLARSYLRRPDLTAEKFIPDPFSLEPGARLYRTGDLARYLPDGQLKYLGRIDYQVKVRGFRIELGEIEAALQQMPEVREAVAMVREDHPDERRLVAYLLLETEHALTSGALRQSLSEKLPAYMIPSAFVFQDQLPRSANGKVNRDALPAPEDARSDLSAAYVAPRDEKEETLARIWAEILCVPKVGVEDNFFDLGGDSILSLQIIARANQAGIKLVPRQIFQHQTITQLAAVAETADSMRVEQGIVTGPAPLTPVQRWFFEQELPHPHHWNQSILLRVRANLDPTLLERAVKQLLLHHDALRMRFTFSEGSSGWEQFNAGAEEDVPLSLVDLSSLPDAEQPEALETSAAQLQAGLNISTGPLLRVALFDLGPHQPHRLLLAIHHLVVDGVSWRILLEDLELAYRQAERAEPIALPPKTTSFKRWAEGLMQYARSAELEREMAYWLAATPEQVSPLPSDFSDGANTEASARTVTTELSVEETHALLRQVPLLYHTHINEVLLSALAEALSQFTNGPSILIDTEGHGREDVLEGADLSRTVGWFTSIYPVSLKQEKHESVLARLKAVKEQLRGIPRYGLGYGVALYLREDEEGDAERAATASTAARLRSMPRADLVFNYLGQLDQPFARSVLFAGLQEMKSPLRDPRGLRAYLLEVNASVVNERLKLDWTYSENVHREATVERLARSFIDAIRAVIKECASGRSYQFMPSDFPLAELDQPALDRLLSSYKEIEDVYPLVPVQQGLLFHSLFLAETGIYVTQLSCLLRGGLNREAFERAWRSVLERQSVLRTAFAWEGLEAPLQVVNRSVALDIVSDDWRSLSLEEQDERLALLLREDRARGFDFQVAPLMRQMLYQLADDVHRFVWSHHHLLLDGWSLPIVLDEVFALYEAFSQGRELDLPPGRPYREYVIWLQRQNLTESEAFWRKALEGFTAPTPLVMDHPQGHARPAQEVNAEQQSYLSQAATNALLTFARKHQLTLNTLLQGAWALLLNRYSGSQDVVFGTAVSGRPINLPGADMMVGIFINTLPVRVQVQEDGVLTNWLREIQERQADVQKHEHTPLVQIQGWSEVPRALPLFESVLILLNYPIADALRRQSRSLRIEELRWLEQTNYPLTIQVTQGAELLVKANYDPRRFDAQTTKRILGHLQTVLTAIGAETESRLYDIPLLTEWERAQLLFEWNDTRRDYVTYQCLHELFEEQVERTPEAVALLYQDEQLSYAELNRRANKLAHHLRSLGVGAEALVGICVERSLEMIVGLLGILKAGAAYVPLDPAYPLERLSFMLEDAALGVLLTQESLAETLPTYWGHVICLDGERSFIEAESDANPARAATADNLAYVIYTSGSTGTPKGAMLTHAGIVNCVRWMQETYRLNETDRFLLKTSLNFDPSVWEIFWTLWTGGRVVIARPEGHLDSAYLVRTILEQEITSVYFVPSMLSFFLQEQGVEHAASVLRRVICGGEKLATETLERFFEKLSDVELHHSYGPTEASIAATEWRAERAGERTTVTIGRPLANTEIYLLDQKLRPVPIRLTGELYIGGVGVGRGYVGRPDLTASSFVPHHFSAQPGARLYRTGDLARYLPDGRVEFMGRADSQVKVRGYRIELGEIESVLCTHMAIDSAVAVTRENDDGQMQIAAYVTARDDSPATTEELRGYLREKLPEHMIPAWLVILDQMPLTATGKVDRRALPRPEASGANQDAGQALPRTPTEEVIAGIWAEVLGIEHPGVEADFFELGGHSLLATQVMLRLREAFGVDIQLRSLFEHPTVRGLASQVEETINAQRGVALPALERVERNETMPLSFAQQRLWFDDQLNPDSALYNMATALHLSGHLDVLALERTIREIIRRHEVLRTSFPSHQGQPLQLISPSVDFSLPLLDLSTLDELDEEERESKARELAQQEAERPFDLSTGPLLRVQLMKLGEEEHVVVLVMHHIVSDGWSMGILIREVGELYEGYVEGEESRLGELEIQYGDYAIWQREWLTGEVLERELEYWTNQLGGELPALELPFDRPRPVVQSFKGVHQGVMLTEEVSESLKELSRREGVTLFMTLLAAWQVLIYRYTGQERFNVGTPVAGRNQLATEELIGFFINTLVLRGDLSGNPTFTELLKRVRATALAAYAHQDLPFEKLVEVLQPERSLDRSPLFQVSFSMLDNPVEKLHLKNLRFEEFPFEAMVAKFDLTLLVTDAEHGLKAVLEYNSELFDTQTVRRMAETLQALLQSIVAEPQSRLETLLEILAAEDRKRRSLKAQEFKAGDRRMLKNIRRKIITG